MSAPLTGSQSPPLSGLRVAVVGGGRMARHHARAISRTGARVVAVAEPDAEARRGFQELEERPGQDPGSREPHEPPTS